MQDLYRVLGALKADPWRTHIIRNDEIEVLGVELLCGALRCAALGGEADELSGTLRAWSKCRCDSGEEIGCWLKMEGERAITTQLLSARTPRHAEVGDRRGGDEEICGGCAGAGGWRQECAAECRVKVGNGGDAHDLHPLREWDGDARGDQHDVSAAITCRFGESDTLSSR